MATQSIGKAWRISGWDQLKPAIERWGQRGAQAIAQALYEEAENLMTQAKRLTPVDTGALRASGFVRPPVIGPRLITVALGFGGPAGSGNHGGTTNAESVGYSVYVHEDLTAYHATGQAKFLEVPVVAKLRTLERDLGARTRKILAERGLG